MELIPQDYIKQLYLLDNEIMKKKKKNYKVQLFTQAYF